MSSSAHSPETCVSGGNSTVAQVSGLFALKRLGRGCGLKRAFKCRFASERERRMGGESAPRVPGASRQAKRDSLRSYWYLTYPALRGWRVRRIERGRFRLQRWPIDYGLPVRVGRAAGRFRAADVRSGVVRTTCSPVVGESLPGAPDGHEQDRHGVGDLGASRGALGSHREPEGAPRARRSQGCVQRVSSRSPASLEGIT